MPFRRLPNSDPSRILALQKAISKEGYKEDGQLVLSYQTIRDVQQLYSKFRNAHRQYRQYHDMYLAAVKTCRETKATVQMYLKHFVKVLNMCIERGELRADIRQGYGLDPDSASLPPLTKDSDIYSWGRKIIEGEEKRVQQGGVPLYNPNIAKVKVHYSIFADQYFNMTTYKQNAEKYRKELLKMRPLVDDLLLDLSIQIENFYAKLPAAECLKKCESFGISFYPYNSSKKQSEADKLQNLLDF